MALFSQLLWNGDSGVGDRHQLSRGIWEYPPKLEREADPPFRDVAVRIPIALPGRAGLAPVAQVSGIAGNAMQDGGDGVK